MIKLHWILAIQLLTALWPMAAHATTEEWQNQVASIASELVETLNVNDKFVVKSLSPDETGLPEDFLRKVTGEIAASVLKSSNFQISLVNRFTTDELWSEAIEFGNADFQDLYNASSADNMIFIEPRLSGSGIDITVSVYGLTGQKSGLLIASSGSKKLDINVQQDLGIDLKTVDDSLSGIEQKLVLLEKMLATDEDMSGNQLSKIFFEFAAPSSSEVDLINPIDFAYLFKGCDSPTEVLNEPFTNVVGDTVFPYDKFGTGTSKVFEMQCEVYNGGELIVPKNIEKRTKLPIFLILHTRSGLNSIRIEQAIAGEGELRVPDDVEPFISNAWCPESNTVSNGQIVYDLEFPGRNKVWLLEEFSSGSAGTIASLTLATKLDDFSHLFVEPLATYRSCEKIDGTNSFSSYPSTEGAPFPADMVKDIQQKLSDAGSVDGSDESEAVSSEELEDVALELFVVANTMPPDAYLSLRTDPTSKSGSRITIMPNGTQLEVIERRDDGWWLVRTIETNQLGWAKSGRPGVDWIVPNK